MLPLMYYLNPNKQINYWQARAFFGIFLVSFLQNYSDQNKNIIEFN